MDDGDGYFGERVAESYDEANADMFEPGVVDAVVEVLAGLASGGRALELGIGTGRIVLPLARRGVAVHGIDLSRAMVARLRAKPGGEAIGVTIGDFPTVRVEGTFTLAYLVFNTIMNLTTQAAQVACFRNVAAHLAPGGCFVIEVMVPELRRVPPGDTRRCFRLTDGACGSAGRGGGASPSRARATTTCRSGRSCRRRRRPRRFPQRPPPADPRGA